MRPVRTIAAALLVASIAVAGCSTRDTSPPGDAAPSTAAPATPAPRPPTPDQMTPDQPNPRSPVARPPGTAEAVATAVSFMRREVGMARPVAGPFRRTGATTGQVDIHASSSPAADVVTVPSEPVTTVSLQRLRTVWYVTGTRTPAIKVLSPQPRDAVRSPVGVLGVAPAAVEGQVRVRVTRDRYGKDIELGSGSLTADNAGAGGEFSGEIAFARPSGTAGSVVFTAGGNGQVAAATVVRVRFATSQPPRIQQVITTPKLSEKDGRLLLPDRVEIQVFATGADRARLVLTHGERRGVLLRGGGRGHPRGGRPVPRLASRRRGDRFPDHPGDRSRRDRPPRDRRRLPRVGPRGDRWKQKGVPGCVTGPTSAPDLAAYAAARSGATRRSGGRMQLIEVSSFAMRSAVVRLRRSGTPLEFVLFPMIHQATPAFYAEIMARLGRCQLIVAEGVGKTAVVQALTLVYRLSGRAGRWGLVPQRLALADLGVPVLCPDMSADQFRRGWRRLPVVVKLSMFILVPVYAVGVLVFGSRRFLADRIGSTEDLPTRDEELAADGRFDKLVELLLDDRDALLVQALEAIHEQRSQEPISVAVVYGAAHMPAVARALAARYGYRPMGAESVTVFRF